MCVYMLLTFVPVRAFSCVLAVSVSASEDTFLPPSTGTGQASSSKPGAGWHALRVPLKRGCSTERKVGRDEGVGHGCHVHPPPPRLMATSGQSIFPVAWRREQSRPGTLRAGTRAASRSRACGMILVPSLALGMAQSRHAPVFAGKKKKEMRMCRPKVRRAAPPLRGSLVHSL